MSAIAAAVSLPRSASRPWCTPSGEQARRDRPAVDALTGRYEHCMPARHSAVVSWERRSRVLQDDRGGPRPACLGSAAMHDRFTIGPSIDSGVDPAGQRDIRRR